MNYIRVSYKKYSKIYNLIFFIMSIGVTLGMIVSLCLNDELINDIYVVFTKHISDYNSNIINNILYPIITYLILFIISLTILGVFIPFLAFFIENVSIGLIIGILLKSGGLKALLFGMLYFLFTKFLYMIILIYLILNICKFIIKLINSIKNKNNNSIYNLYSRILLKVVFSIIFITTYNIIGIFIIPKIINMFIFLL